MDIQSWYAKGTTFIFGDTSIFYVREGKGIPLDKRYEGDRELENPLAWIINQLNFNLCEFEVIHGFPMLQSLE